MCGWMKLPVEIWIEVLRHVDVRALSAFSCACKTTRDIVKTNRWEIIDLMTEVDWMIPGTVETYNEYRFIIDFTLMIVEQKRVIPEYVLEEMGDRVDIALLSTFQEFSEDFVRKCFHRIALMNLLQDQKLPMDVLNYIVCTTELNVAHWHHICRNQRLTVEFVDTYEQMGLIQWNALSDNKDALTIELVAKYADRLIWHELTKHGVSEDILMCKIRRDGEDSLDYFCWCNIAMFTKLSPVFIQTYIHKLPAFYAMRAQDVPQECIMLMLEMDGGRSEEHALWQSIGLRQPLTKEFVLVHQDKLRLSDMIRNKNIKRTVLHRVFGGRF